MFIKISYATNTIVFIRHWVKAVKDFFIFFINVASRIPVNFVLRFQGKMSVEFRYVDITVKADIYIIYLSVPLIFPRYEISREKFTNSKGEIFDNLEATNHTEFSLERERIFRFNTGISFRSFVSRLPNVLLSLSRTILYYIFPEKTVKCKINVGKCKM